MSGSIEEIPLPDLLQLLSTSRKSGVLVVRSDWGVGKIYLRKGQIYFANIDDELQHRPAQGDVPDAGLDQGFFDLEPPDERAVLEELQDSTEGLLMEGMRQLDEYRVMIEKLPPLRDDAGGPAPARAQAARARSRGAGHLPGRARRGHGARDVRRVRRPDLTIAEKAKALLDKGYLVAGR